MKTFKELRSELLEVGPISWAVQQQTDRGRETKSQRAQQHPLEIGKSGSKPASNAYKSSELEKQSKEPPKNPMKMDDPGSTYTKTSGGIVKFPKQPTPIKLATPTSVSAEPSRAPVTAPVKQFQGITPEVKKDGSVQPVQSAIKKEIKAPKPPSVNRQVSTMVGNSKAAGIRRAAKPETTMKSSAKPAQEPIKTLPTVNVTARKEKDPNVGGGFVTAGVSKGPKGELRTVNVARGTADTTALPHKKTGLDIPLQKPSNVASAPAKSWQQTSTKSLPAQGSVARDVELAKRGFKKF